MACECLFVAMVIGYILIKVNVISSSYKKYLNVLYYFFACIALIYLLVINWVGVDTFKNRFIKRHEKLPAMKDWKTDAGLMGLIIFLYIFALIIFYFICKALGIIELIIVIFYEFAIVTDMIVLLLTPSTKPPTSERINEIFILQNGLSVVFTGLILNDIFKLCA
jgi:hypothetical protein